MEGPTPVSALIHAATMVNAGLYLVARMFHSFAAAEVGSMATLAIIIAIIGGVTACMAALIAFVQNDLREVLAYSTMSQLAYIFTGLGAALWLVNNGYDALSKVAFGAAIPFVQSRHGKRDVVLASGSVIHEMHHAHHEVHHHDHDDGHHEDEGEHHDDHPVLNPWKTWVALRVACQSQLLQCSSVVLQLLAFTLIGGFWSKEGIIANAWKVALKEPIFFIPAILVLLTAAMTGFYMSRMWFMTFAGKPKTEVDQKSTNRLHGFQFRWSF